MIADALPKSWSLSLRRLIVYLPSSARIQLPSLIGDLKLFRCHDRPVYWSRSVKVTVVSQASNTFWSCPHVTDIIRFIIHCINNCNLTLWLFVSIFNSMLRRFEGYEVNFISTLIHKRFCIIKNTFNIFNCLHLLCNVLLIKYRNE
jgi:hypothetical protein